MYYRLLGVAPNQAVINALRGVSQGIMNKTEFHQVSIACNVIVECHDLLQAQCILQYSGANRYHFIGENLVSEFHPHNVLSSLTKNLWYEEREQLDSGGGGALSQGAGHDGSFF